MVFNWFEDHTKNKRKIVNGYIAIFLCRFIMNLALTIFKKVTEKNISLVVCVVDTGDQFAASISGRAPVVSRFIIQSNPAISHQFREKNSSKISWHCSLTHHLFVYWKGMDSFNPSGHPWKYYFSSIFQMWQGLLFMKKRMKTLGLTKSGRGVGDGTLFA
jgi:hypothetical protein